MLFFCFCFLFSLAIHGESGAGIVGLGCHYLSNLFAGFRPTLPRPFQTSEETRVTLVGRLPDEWQQKCH